MLKDAYEFHSYNGTQANKILTNELKEMVWYGKCIAAKDKQN